MSHHTKLDENIEGDDNFRAWKYRISLVLEENELDSYITEEVPVPEGDEAKALHKNKLVMVKRIISVAKFLWWLVVDVVVGETTVSK